jgi:hypothetical protein
MSNAVSHSLFAVAAPRASCASQRQKVRGGVVQRMQSKKLIHRHRQTTTFAAAAATGAVEVSTHTVPSGLKLEVLSQKAAAGSTATKKPPLVFVHGSYHAAWCWSENFFQFFSDRGGACTS